MKDEPDKTEKENNYILFRAVPTMRCNYRCDYCFVSLQERSTTETMFDKHTPDEWIRAMKHFDNYEVAFYLGGGEPFVIDGTYKLIEGWTQYDHVITGSRADTNLAFFDQIAKRCPTDKLQLNCSWHPQYDSLDQMYGKVKKLNDLGMVGMVNFVASQYNLRALRDKYHLSIDELIKRFDDMGVFVNVATDFSLIRDKDPATYADYKRMILKYLCPEDWRQRCCEKPPSFCEANHHYFTIHANGDLVPCQSGQPCGNFFEGTLQFPERAVCDKRCPCLGLYCFRTDNDFLYERYLTEFVNRNREYRKSTLALNSTFFIPNSELKVAGQAATSLTPLVSIVLPTYNHLRFLPKAVESVLGQTYPNFELIIINDGSTDGTCAYLEGLKDPRIRVIHQGNKGLPEALNTGFRAAHGELLTWISSDNYCAATFLEVFVSAMEANPNAGLAYSAFARINEDGQVIKVTDCPDMDYSRLLLSFPGMSSFMYRRGCQETVGLYDPALEGAEDWDMWLRIAERFPIVYVPDILYYYRQHSGSLTAQKPNVISKSSRLVVENATDRLRTHSPRIAYEVALNCFLKAKEEFNRGNFEAALEHTQRYRSLIDYSELPRRLKASHRDEGLDISVIIVTYNRTNDLKRCLESLANQDGTNFEIIVVDNGQSDAKVCQRYADQYIKCPINFNLSEGRNIGAHFARGDTIVFLDDDALVGADYISSIESAFDQFDIFGLRGRAYPKSGPDANSHVSIYDLGDRPFPSYCNQEGNSAWLLEVYKSMGGMDPLLFGHEGSDLTYRIIKEYKQPNKIIYWPSAIIYHDFGTADKSRQKKKTHRQSANYLKYKHNTDIFVNRTDIERYPLPLKQNQTLSGEAPCVVEDLSCDKVWDKRHPVKCPELSEVRSFDTVYLASAGRLHPKVSIVISCCNCEESLRECLNSIRNQTMNEWELFLLDDGSTDSTRRVIEEYCQMDERMKPYYFRDNKGPYIRRNFAIERANSDFIIIQDADDIMCPTKLEMLYKEITKDEKLGIVGSSYWMFLDEFKGLECADRVELPITHDEIMDNYFSARYVCWHGSSIIRKRMFEAIGLYDEHPYGSDKLWLAKAAEYARFSNEARFRNIAEGLTLKREHPLSQQGLLPPLDPRSRRARFQTYWEYKLSKIRERIHNNPSMDIKAELRNCKCNDFTKRYGCLFEQWESEPLDDTMLCRLISRGVERFNKGKYVRCIIALDGVERIVNDVAERFKNYDLLRAMASYAIDRKQQCLKYLNREIENHNNAAARQFISDYFEKQLKADVRSWCVANGKLFNLGMIDTEREIGSEQGSCIVSERHIPAQQDKSEESQRSAFGGETAPLVSVIMPAYNAADYITKAIASVLAQSYRNFELIVINDGSTDQTEDLVLRFKDERIKYFYQENSGLAATHNVGIKKSKGAFTIKLDCDDMMTPDFIARHLQEFEKHPEADLVYCDDYLIDENDNPIRLIKRPEYTDRKSLIRDLFRCGFPIVPFRTCIRRSVFDRTGFFDENLRMAEDYDMMRRFVKEGLKIHHLNGALYVRRMTNDSLSRNFTAENASFHFDVVRRFTDTFSYDELFPDVNWEKIAPERRQLHAKCLAAVTLLAIGHAYIKSNAPAYVKTAFEQARLELEDSLKIDPANQLARQLLQKCELARAGYEQPAQADIC